MGTNKVRGGESLCTTFYFKNDVNNDSLRNVTFYSVDSLRGKGGEDRGVYLPDRSGLLTDSQTRECQGQTRHSCHPCLPEFMLYGH